MNSKNLLVALRELQQIHLRCATLMRDLDYVLIAEELTAEEHQTVQLAIDKVNSILTILQGDQNAKRT